MIDRELLELAAKSAGIETWHENVFTSGLTQKVSNNGVLRWNPLTDDGDALRLAVKLRLSIENGEYDVSVEVWFELGNLRRVNEFYGEDACAATRRAIVRAAAEIGKEMK
jgi:hypothetical protein